MKVIIIEDEQKTARELKTMIESIDSDIEVIKILPSVSAAIKWFLENDDPDLIFSDIQLGDGLSFEIFKEVQTEAPVIFCTAFDQYAIRAFNTNSIDYLLKPIDTEMLQASLEKYIRLTGNPAISNEYGKNLENLVVQMDTSYRQTFLVHYRDKIIPVRATDILYAHASNRAVTIHVQNDRTYAVQFTIEQLESMLNPRQFFRANRKFIINRDCIANIERYFNRKLFIATQVETPEKIIVSKLKAQVFLKWLEV
ncbi:MAG: response regulator transcription factor [Mucilaginibacter polytrichastri]|nr:response regulator transcription factor [Mucilaginibacter polytrichastri]